MRVPYNQTRTVQFTKVVTGDQLSLHQAGGGQDCKVEAAIVGTYGRVFES